MSFHQGTKKAVNVSLDTRVVEEAKRLGVNISQAAEEGLRAAVREAWVEENRESMEAWGRWAEKNGLPLEKYRMF